MTKKFLTAFVLFLFVCPNLFGQNGLVPGEFNLENNDFNIERTNESSPNVPENVPNVPDVGGLPNASSALGDGTRSTQNRSPSETLRATLAKYAPSSLRLESVSPRTVLLFSLPYGAEASFLIGTDAKNADENARPIYAIGALCWNVPCSGRTLLRLNNKTEIVPPGAIRQTVRRPNLQWGGQWNDSGVFWNDPQSSLWNDSQNAAFPYESGVIVPSGNSPIFQYAPPYQEWNPSKLVLPNPDDRRAFERPNVFIPLEEDATAEKEILVRIGLDFQKSKGEFLAALAFSAIATNYEIRIGERAFQIQNLVESEKRRCFLNEDLSWLAIGLSIYLADFQETWTNCWGQDWSLEKVAKHEMLRPVDWGSAESTDKLLGLTLLLRRTERELTNPELPNRENFEKMATLIRDYLSTLQTSALTARDENRLWTNRYFLTDQPTLDRLETLQTTANQLRWLVLFSTVPQKFADANASPEIVQENERIKNQNQARLQELQPSVLALASSLETAFPSARAREISQLSPLEIETLCSSLHSIALFLQRLE